MIVTGDLVGVSKATAYQAVQRVRKAFMRVASFEMPPQEQADRNKSAYFIYVIFTTFM